MNKPIEEPGGSWPVIEWLGYPLALASMVLTVLVVLSPIGIGSGSSVIGYSVYRLLIFVLIQLPVALLGIGGVIASLSSDRFSWGVLALHLGAIIAAFFLYFSQGNTVCRFLTC